MGKGLAIVVISAALSAVVGSWTSRPGKTETVSAPDHSGEVSKLRDELNRMQSTLRRLQLDSQRSAQITPEAPAQAPTAEEAPSIAPEAIEGSAEADAKQVTAHREFLADLRGAETPDPSWAARSRSALENAIGEGKPMPGSDIEALDCSASVCEARVGHADEKAQSEFAYNYMVSLAGEVGEALTIPETDGDQLVTTIYFARPSAPLPKQGT